MDFQLTSIKIKIEGESNEISFSDLAINQYMADVNNFSFTWRQPEGGAGFTNQVNFNKKTLSKKITINIHNHLIFEGIVTAIHCGNQNTLGVEYEISGKGMFEKLNEVVECNSFYKKTVDKIFSDLNTTQGTTLSLHPTDTSELFYTVQYGQTTFEFYKMMAARMGEWLYYTGQKMVLSKPTGDAIPLKSGVDVDDLNFSSNIVSANDKSVGFDRFKGEAIKSTNAPGTINAPMVSTSMKAGADAYSARKSNIHFTNAATQGVLDKMHTMQQKAKAARTVVISASSHRSDLALATKIKLTDEHGDNAGEYYITEIHHFCSDENNYQNHFSAVPAEHEVPPYTNPLLFPQAKAQPAIVVDNEDKDGQDRMKVRFPWQKETDTTPWLNMLTPYAGKDKGFRFIPELEEEVMVDFLDNNAEKPYVLGAMHTDKNKSGNDHTGNHLKIIGSRSGRRLEIDDNAGALRLYDNYTKKTPKNGLIMKRTKDDTQMLIESQKNDDNYCVIALTNEESLNLGVVNGGELIVEIKMEKDGKKITIHSKGSIELNADQSISLNAANININASQELKLEGKAKGTGLKGQKIEIEATTTASMKGVNTTVEGSAKLDLKGGAAVEIGAAIVKIN